MINPYYTEIFQGAQDEAAEHDLFPIMINTTTDEKYEQNILNKLKNLKLNGLISLGTNLQPEQWIEFQEETGMPIVILDSLVKHPRIITISLKNEVASGRAIQHLLDLNHTRIAYLGIAGDESSAARLRGIETMLARRRLAMPSGFAVEFKNDNLGILQGIGRLVTLPLNERPTAMIVYNDYLAISAMHAIRVHGLRIPEDISIIGFDNIPMATHTNPPLTTVDMPKYQMGQMVVKLLQQLKKNGTNTGGQIYMDNTLIVRESTGPAPVY